MAVNIKKLRVGNIVAVAGKMIVVESVYDTMINVRPDQDGDIDGWSENEVDHVRIVPRMLIEFGFDKVSGQVGIIISAEKIVYTHPCGMMMTPMTDGSFILPNYPNHPITTVTQVQNILLDLFNFDLIIQL